MPKVREIAKKLSLSPATVSKTLSGNYGTGRASTETAKRVLDFCFHHGYLNRSERDRILLKMNIEANDKKLFCISSYEGLWGYNSLFSNINRQLQHNGQYTSFFTIKNEADLSRFPYSQASAVIIFGRIHLGIYKLLQEHSVPLVLLDNAISKFKCHMVNSSNLASMSKAVGILAQEGHKRIAFMCRHEDDSGLPTYNLHQRQAGYIVGMSDLGFSTEGLIFTTNSAPNGNSSAFADVEGELRLLAQRLLSADPRPTAVIAANDLTAHILRTVAREQSLKVPGDLSIIGYDGQHRLPGIMGFEPVSTMVVNWEEMATAAVDLAHELIVDPSKPSRNIEIPAEYEDMGTVSAMHSKNYIR